MLKSEIIARATDEAKREGYNPEFLAWFLNSIASMNDAIAEIQFRRFFDGGTEE